MQVTFFGEGAWPREYMLIFAVFDAEGKIPVKSKIISQPDNIGSPVSVTLNGLNEEVKTIAGRSGPAIP